MLVSIVSLLALLRETAHASSEVAGSSNSWRVVASTTRSGWAWDVARLNFVTKEGILQLGDDCSVIHSGSVSDGEHGGIPGYEPENAFSSNRPWWGGRKSADQFYLGIKCAKPKVVRAVQILQEGGHVTDAVAVQRSDGNEWTTVQNAVLHEQGGLEIIQIACDEEDLEDKDGALMEFDVFKAVSTWVNDILQAFRNDTPSRSDFTALKKSKLQDIAYKYGATKEEVDAALDEDDSKAALVDLVLTKVPPKGCSELCRSVRATWKVVKEVGSKFADRLGDIKESIKDKVISR